jgi:tetratricopeptide (TPR) repeat protein
MLGFAWVTLRQAQEALQNGRLEEAHRLLSHPGAQGHKGTWEMLRQIAKGYVERGERHLRHDDVAGAWSDLLQAEQIGAEDTSADRLRQTLAGRGLTEAKALLEAGETGRAAQVLGQLRQRSVQLAEISWLEEAAKGWHQARELADRGEFPQAVQAVERVRRLLPKTPATLDRFEAELENRRKNFGDLLVQLHEAAQEEQWRKVLQLAEQVLALAPQHAEARKVRSRAWKSIEPPTMEHVPGRLDDASPAARGPGSERFLLWVDGVGGFLVCLGNRVTLGQAAPDAAIDIPLYADVSRLHATLTRDTEGYLLEASRPVQLNARPVEKALLQPGDRLTLGSCCQLRFHQPVPVSATARLDLVSGHRLPLAVDGVLLMAETLVLGPGPQAHVIVPELKQPVVLFRQKEGLGVRWSGNLVVDGQSFQERASLGPASRVTSDDFTFAIEQIGTKIGKSV